MVGLRTAHLIELNAYCASHTSAKVHQLKLHLKSQKHDRSISTYIMDIKHYKRNANYIRNITYGSKSVCKINITYEFFSVCKQVLHTEKSVCKQVLHTEKSVCNFWCHGAGRLNQVPLDNSKKI